MKDTQIFQTNSVKRWRNYKWSFRVFLIILVFFIVVLGIALFTGSNPSLPNLEEKSKVYQGKMDPSNPFTLSQKFNKKYKGFKDFLDKKIKEDSFKTPNKQGVANQAPFIRAAFYSPWKGKAALTSLDKYGSNLNVIFPEWFFIDTINHTLQTRIDSIGLQTMRAKALKIMPMLTNFNSALGDFDGKLLHSIFNNNTQRQKFIQQIVDTLTHYGLQGINIDFENINDNSNNPLTIFQKELYQSLHANGFTITMDVAVKNDDYDYEKLSDYNDYIILMAYDQFEKSTKPGPICAQKWIEECVDWTVKKIDPKKIILGIAGYGYDWKTDEEGKIIADNISYTEAINRAQIKNAKIDFNNDNYNLNFTYIDEEKNSEGNIENIRHDIWFTDAATTFNVMRFSDEYSTAGTALWLLGSEDARMWNFYQRDLSAEALKKIPINFAPLSAIPIIPDNVGYDGEGEVLNIIASPQVGKVLIEIDTAEMLIAEQQYNQLPSGYIIQKFAEDTTKPGPGHKLILTFDDGPDPVWTPQILSILEKEKVPATFFIVGLQGEKNIPLLQRINKDGFEIGNHTFTHKNVA